MSNMQLNLITLMIISSARMTQHYYNLTDLKHRFIKCPFLTLTQCGRLFFFNHRFCLNSAADWSCCLKIPTAFSSMSLKSLSK